MSAEEDAGYGGAQTALPEEERKEDDAPMAGADDKDGQDDEGTSPVFGELLSISSMGDSLDLQAMFYDFGIAIQLPGNSNWIQDVQTAG